MVALKNAYVKRNMESVSVPIPSKESSINTFYEQLNRALKYSARERLPVSAIHPELRYTRLGAILREHATEPSEVGELAYQALTSPHKQPLELMPLHLLRDKMQEEPDNPLNHSKLTWQTLPERVHLDQTISRAVNDWNQSPESGLGTADYDDGRIDYHHLNSNRQQPSARTTGILKVLQKAHDDHGGSVNDVADSARRLMSQHNYRWSVEGDNLTPDPEEVHNRLARSTAIRHPSETYR